MRECIYLCQQCRNVFQLPSFSVSLPETEVKCPKCGSSHTEEVPSWAPVGSGLNESPPWWEYECQQCQNVFKLPVPSSPSKEKEIRCPECGGGHIHRLTPMGGVPLYCG